MSTAEPQVDDDTRARLRAVLLYMVGMEARAYWLECTPAERKTLVYAKALRLMRTFGFQDLLELDASYRGAQEPGGGEEGQGEQ